MSRENVEVVRAAFEAYARGDLAGTIDRLDEDVVIQPIIGPEWHGAQGFLDMVVDWLEGFDQFSMTAEEFIDAGDHVIVRLRQEGRGTSTGVPVQVTFWFVYTFKDAKVIRLAMFQDREPAFEAAGVSEQDAHADS